MTAPSKATSVLVVEDDNVLRGAYETVLSMEGYQAHVAADGLEALKLVDSREFDVILLDMLMPNLGGLEFLQSFDAKTKHPNTKIIVFSNMMAPSDVKDALDLGATKYLTKSSFTPKEMESIIKEVLVGE